MTAKLCVYITSSRQHKQTSLRLLKAKTQVLARQCFHFQNGLNPSFMPTQQRPSMALTESLTDQFYLIRQLTFKKLVLASQFFFARYFLRFARELVPLYWHCLMMVAFDALFKIYINLFVYSINQTKLRFCSNSIIVSN
ncbi:Hypothetical_protein [Hexamita inflata]|uniref:Hypothetical_protein n=1 Tax=Hexamita inflata TaxID=28002 RepID=A0AA86UM61_9EUKA|nr:Hypothetical protein HINF_LOCUS51330 [Hexamita inflata]